MKKLATIINLFAIAGLALAGCTVKSVEQEGLTGPSTFAHSIIMTATRDTLTQNGQDFTDITVTSRNSTGQSEPLQLSAQVLVDGIAMDFGTLSAKTLTAPTTLRYTVPAPSPLSVQVPTTVTIMVTPVGSDSRGNESQTRSIDIRVLPQGVILPTNPNLRPDFTIDPEDPEAFQTVTFDASTTINGPGDSDFCLQLCTYLWDFGDRTTGAGRIATHQYRAGGTFAVTLLVTDSRGAQAVRTKSLPVAQPTPPDAFIDATPSSPVAGQDVFFSASRTTSPTGRAIVNYEWNFGDGYTATGVTTSHRFNAQGTYTVSLKVTDDVGAVRSVTTSVTVAAGGPTVSFTVLPTSPRVNNPVTVNITATPTGATTIRNYTINWGDGTVETVTASTQSHTYGGSGTVVITVTATDNLGHQRSATQAVTITP